MALKVLFLDNQFYISTVEYYEKSEILQNTKGTKETKENPTLWVNPLILKIIYFMKNSPKYDRESIQLLKLNICY